jgi:hypothetical protein
MSHYPRPFEKVIKIFFLLYKAVLAFPPFENQFGFTMVKNKMAYQSKTGRLYIRFWNG